MHRCATYLILLTIALLANGCSNGPVSATIEGEVTVDGKPLDKGFICFAPTDGNGSPVTVEIRDGRYFAHVAEGNKVVQISAPRVIGQRKASAGPSAPMVDITEESLPASYNSLSRLQIEVKGGSNKKDWAVESIKSTE